jgi:hypothetical protein
MSQLLMLNGLALIIIFSLQEYPELSDTTHQRKYGCKDA